MGTITITVNSTDYMNDKRVVFGTLAMSNSYLTGGDSFTLSALGFEALEFFDMDTPANVNFTGANAYVLGWAGGLPANTGFNTTMKVQAFATGSGNGNALVEAANTTNLANYQTEFMAIGW